MIRSAMRAGAAGLLSLGTISAGAAAELPVQRVAYVSGQTAQKDNSARGSVRLTLASGADYKDVLAQAERHPNVYTGEAWISDLLSDPALPEAAKPRVLYARAQHRWKKSSNKVGAWEDFSKFARLYPDDLYARNASIEAGYVDDQIDYIETRMENLQTLSAWFDDAWSLGTRDYAAERYKRSGLKLETTETDRFIAAGYICQAPDRAVPASYRAANSDTPNLYWCQ